MEAVPVTAGEARAYLARFLFRGDDAFKEVRMLSGGERSRLELALLGIQPSNLLLLDEPTNHLDIPAREAIEAFMAELAGDAAGGVARSAVAGDGVREVVGRGGRVGGGVRWRISRVAGGGGGWMDGGGGAGDRRRRGCGAAAGPSVARSPLPTALRLTGRGRARARRRVGGRGRRTPPPSRKSGKKEKLSKEAYRRQKAAAEGELTRLGLRKNHLELAMGDPAVQGNFVEMRRVTSELADIDVALAAAEDAWLDLEERAP